MCETELNCQDKIVVLDSGLGGVTVLTQLLKILPNENFLYFADTGNAPYGEKNSDEIRTITFNNAKKFYENGAKALVIACNTASGAGAAIVRESFPDFPVICIEPAIKPAVSSFPNKRILVMATPLTIHQEKFAILFNQWHNQAEVIPLECPGLASLIEEDIYSTQIDSYLNCLFAPYHDKSISGIVLGCTHYPLIRERISRAVPEAKLFDGGEGTARQVKRILEEKNILSYYEKGLISLSVSDIEHIIDFALKFERLLEQSMSDDHKQQ